MHIIADSRIKYINVVGNNIFSQHLGKKLGLKIFAL